MASSSTEESDTSPPPPNQRQHQVALREKRKRTNTTSTSTSHHPQRRRRGSTVSSPARMDDSDPTFETFDPEQPLHERRKIQHELRALAAQVAERGDELLAPDSTGIQEALATANNLTKNVRQTNEATIDSRLLLQLAELTNKKTAALSRGGVVQGLDLDDFVSKCVTYMRLGRGIADDDAVELSSTQRQRRRPSGRRSDGTSFSGGLEGEDDDVGDDGDALHWSHLGRFGCIPFSPRPALVGFLNGPVQVEKKARRVVARRAQLKVGDLKEVRPEVIEKEDLGRNEKNDLTSTCANILKLLDGHLEKWSERINDAIEDVDNEDDSERIQRQMMDQAGLRVDSRGEASADLLRFVVDPESFGQTVENMFYVSFLIRDGKVRLDFDQENGFPILTVADKDSADGPGAGTQRTSNSGAKHQAVLSMDMGTWRGIIDAFDIKKAIIPHRNEERHDGPGARGWYG